jgi:formylmethanofuran dehydrogenase subunit E
MQNDNMTQAIEDCDDYTCPCCGGTYTGDDWREVGGELICPDCADKKAENE